ncbi:MAG: hypothetical protein U1F41_10120 [Burkholderiales bacterium]
MLAELLRAPRRPGRLRDRRVLIRARYARSHARPAAHRVRLLRGLSPASRPRGRDARARAASTSPSTSWATRARAVRASSPPSGADPGRHRVSGHDGRAVHRLRDRRPDRGAGRGSAHYTEGRACRRATRSTTRIACVRQAARIALSAGLPPDAFVYCCFNNWKATPRMFDAWMRILSSVANAVLLAHRGQLRAAANLRKEAQARGVDPARLVFAPRLPLAAHLARHRLADLFLDTLPYNAHTTASDALWMGLPVLTCAGDAFLHGRGGEPAHRRGPAGARSRRALEESEARSPSRATPARGSPRRSWRTRFPSRRAVRRPRLRARARAGVSHDGRAPARVSPSNISTRDTRYSVPTEPSAKHIRPHLASGGGQRALPAHSLGQG